jgi:hypothetical protein
MGHHLGIRKGHVGFHLHFTVMGYPLMCCFDGTFIDIKHKVFRQHILFILSSGVNVKSFS